MIVSPASSTSLSPSNDLTLEPAALNTPASTKAPVPTPAPNVALNVAETPEGVALDTATRANSFC